MKVMNLKPNERVREYVERILIIEQSDSTTPFSLPLFANGSPTLLFISGKGILNNAAATHLTLFGQTLLPGILALPEDFVLIAYFLKPYVLYSVFGISALEMTDKPVDLRLLTAKKTAALQEQLLNTVTTEGRIALLDHYILSLASDAENDSSVITYATGKIACNPSGTTLSSLQKELFLTERTFQRMFEKYIGVSPNLYKRVCQFNNAFQQLNHHRFLKLSDIAMEHGYADQSHYIRSFKEFTNLTPKEYLHFGPES